MSRKVKRLVIALLGKENLNRKLREELERMEAELRSVQAERDDYMREVVAQRCLVEQLTP